MKKKRIPKVRGSRTTRTFGLVHSRAIRISTLLLFSSLTFASQPVYACSAPSYDYEPVVLKFTDLRQAVRMQSAREIMKNGKILVYKDYLLINEPDKGIHVYDNRDPAMPIGLGFLPIPGSSDLTIRNDVLYADSYVDLVMIDLTNPASAHSVARLENTFSPRYDPRIYGVDPSEGVITELKLVY